MTDRTYLVTEYCSYCESEVEMRWNTDTDGYKAFCPYCGKRLMLCNECQHDEDGNFIDNCNYCTETDSCKYNLANN